MLGWLRRWAGATAADGGGVRPAGAPFCHCPFWLSEACAAPACPMWMMEPWFGPLGGETYRLPVAEEDPPARGPFGPGAGESAD